MARFIGTRRCASGLILALALAAAGSASAQVVQQSPVIIPEGMRALSLRVDTVIGGAELIDQGIRVDVIARFALPDGSRGDSASSLIVQNLKVLTQRKNVQRDAEGQSVEVFVVTVAITPDQAEKLTRAMKAGARHITLRPRGSS